MTRLYKYEAAGNDFVLIPSLDTRLEITENQVREICDRHYGIGADGVIILHKSDSYDFRMQFFNNDGSGGMMCGNGGRCIVSLARECGISPSGQNGSYIFEAPDGIHTGKVETSMPDGSDIVKLSLMDVRNPEIILTQETEYLPKAYRINTGCDHLVLFTRKSPLHTDLLTEGPRWRHDPRFAPKGVNVNFAYISSPEETPLIELRTFEKGVEYETLSCGTGVVATAIAAYLETGNRFLIHTKSGSVLTCEFNQADDSAGHFTDIYITGCARKVFSTDNFVLRK